MKMYTLFLQLLYPDKYLEYQAVTDAMNIKCEVKYKFYYDYYKQTFNYVFGRPRSDACCQRTAFEADIQAEKIQQLGSSFTRSSFTRSSLTRRRQRYSMKN